MKNKNIIKKVIKTMIITSFIFITTGSYLLIDSPKEEKLVKEEIIIPDEYKTFEFNQKDENENDLVKYLVYDHLTYDELVNKLNNSLNSNLSNTGSLFLDASLKYNIDPYLAVAIALHETGCKWNCSTLVTRCNNVGGIKGYPSCGSGGYQAFDSIEDGIYKYVENISKNYYAYGYTTAETMQRKYTGYANSTWAVKVNNYINQIKNS